jgi:hypothetical protein
MEARFLYAAAPVLCGIKPAALIPIRTACLETWKLNQNALRKATGLRTVEIRTRKNTALLFIYDASALREALRKSRASPFLARYGYPAGYDTGAKLDHLQNRFLECDIPHEIGVFLGYPVEDVLGFIENAGKNCLCCRHWKVYHNAERAREMFRQIDEAHSRALDILREPKLLHIAARLLKAA